MLDVLINLITFLTPQNPKIFANNIFVASTRSIGKFAAKNQLARLEIF